MKEKFLAALHKMKREQMVIWLLLLALAVVIFWPVDLATFSGVVM